MAKRALAVNPIGEAEFRHVRQTHLTGAVWWPRLRRALYRLMLLVCCILYFGEWAGALLWRDTQPIHAAFGLFLPFLVIFAVGMQLDLVFRTLALAVNSITRERESGTWDLLLLTRVDARRIVFGKWWAIIRATLRNWLLLVPIRVGLVTFYGAAISRESLWFIRSFDSSVDIAPPSPLGLLLVLPLLLAFTVVNAAVVASLGLLASALVRRSGMAMPAAVVFMIALLVLTALAGLGVHRVIYESYQVGDTQNYEVYTQRINVLQTLIVTTVDNGTTLGVPLVSYRLLPIPVNRSESTWQLGGVTGMDAERFAAFRDTVVLALVTGVVFVRALLWAAVQVVRRA